MDLQGLPGLATRTPRLPDGVGALRLTLLMVLELLSPGLRLLEGHSANGGVGVRVVTRAGGLQRGAAL